MRELAPDRVVEASGLPVGRVSVVKNGPVLAVC